MCVCVCVCVCSDIECVFFLIIFLLVHWAAAGWKKTTRVCVHVCVCVCVCEINRSSSTRVWYLKQLLVRLFRPLRQLSLGRRKVSELQGWGDDKRQEGQTEYFLLLSPSSSPSHRSPSVSLSRTCSLSHSYDEKASTLTSTHTHTHTPAPLLTLLFHFKKSWLSGTPSCPPAVSPSLSPLIRLHLADSIIHQLLSGRRLHSDCKFHVLSIRPSTPLSICFPRAAIRPSSRTWMCYNDSLSSYFTLRSVSFVLFFFYPGWFIFLPFLSVL